MSVINPRSMEVHLLTICERIIRLDDYESGVNTKHLNNICKFLCKEMRENNEMFDQLFESIVSAGSYPDNLKISEPNEYDLLIVLKFPSSSVAPSRPGYVTIKIIDDVDFERFVDEEGYLIQNKVLDWIRGVVRSTLMKHNNVIDADENSYRVYQSSNGPAVTLEVTVVEQNHITFSIDFVGCLAFHSDKWWMADVRKGVGVWNAIPKPIKLNDNVTIQQRIDSKEDVMDNKLPEASNESDKLSSLCTDDGSKMQKRSVESPNENKKGGKVKRPPPFLRYKRPKNVASGERETVTVDYPNRNSRSRFEKPSAVKLNMGSKVDVEEKSRWEKSVKINPSGVTVTKCRPWYRRRTKKIISESKVKEATAVQIGNQKKPSLSVNVMNNHQSTRQQRKPKAMDNAKTTGDIKRKPKVLENAEETGDRQRNSKAVDSTEATGDRKRTSVKQKRKIAKNAPETKQKVREVTIIANPQKNREWICSYAAIEREFLKGTHNMKPLIRIFKKVRDNKQLTNLKSYFIKTIFLHQSDKNGKDYWKQSLAVLFMEMFDVILNYLSAHRLDSFWHKDFNLFRSFREGQLMAMYNILLKMKNDLISNLEDDNPDFIYEVVCTEEERWKLDV